VVLRNRESLAVLSLKVLMSHPEAGKKALAPQFSALYSAHTM